MFPNLRLVMAALVCTLGVAVAFAFVSVRVAHDTVAPRPTQPPSVFQQTLLSASDITFSTMAFNQPAPVISAIPYAEEPHPADPGFAIAPDPQTPASATVTADAQDRPVVDSPVAQVSGKTADMTVAAIAPATIEPPVAQPVTPVVDPIPAAPAMPAPVAEAPAEPVSATEPQAKVAAVEQEPARTEDLAEPVVTSPLAATGLQTQDAASDASKDVPDAQPEPAPAVVASVPDDAPQGGKTATGNDRNAAQGTTQGIVQDTAQSAVIADTRRVPLPKPNPKFAALLNAAAADAPAVKSSEAAKTENEKPAKVASAKSESAKPAKPKAASKATAKASAKPAKKVKKRVVVVRRQPAPAAAAKPAAAANAPFSLFGN